MNCESASPFVSMICDGVQVPDEAARHVAGCGDCQTLVGDWVRIAGSLRIAAAADRLETLPDLRLDDRVVAQQRQQGPVWRSWMSPIRVPRLAAGLATAAFVVTSVGWFRAQTIERSYYTVDYKTTIECQSGGGYLKSTGSGSTRVGAQSGMFNSDSCLPDGLGLLVVVNPLRIENGVVILRLTLAAVSSQHAVEHMNDAADAREYKYVPGQPIAVSLPGGSTATFVATLVEKQQPQQAPVSMASLLPKADELVVAAPALIRDHRTLVMTMNAAATSKAGHVTAIYAPGDGLFLIALARFEGAASAQIGGSILSFEDGGHSYALYSSLPMTGGDQPATVWVRHVADFRPSAHPTSSFQDSFPGIGSGDLVAYLK